MTDAIAAVKKDDYVKGDDGRKQADREGAGIPGSKTENY
jgi:hypothetical protein